MRLDAVRFGLAGAIIESFLIFTLTLIVIASDHGFDTLNQLGIFLPGYEVSMIGSLVGAGYGFICGFATFFIFAFTYNTLGPEDPEDPKE